MEPYRARRKAVFVTFYSFKGGVGRTMSLYSVAGILAGRGRRVLMIDFDLEAPGLTTLKEFWPAETHSQCPCEAGNGLVELIHDYLRDTKNASILSHDYTRFRQDYVCSLPIPEYAQVLEGGSLDLMPCGRMDASYGHRLSQINFREMYREGIGHPLFSKLKETITQSQLYDYVLIDSRTGFSEESGICTRELADYVVLLVGLNHQNISGTVRFLNKLRSSNWQNGRRQHLVLVVSPVPILQETDKVAERLKAMATALAETGYDINVETDLELQIPYTPRLALDENPFTFDWSQTLLYRAYTKIQDRLRALVQDDPRSLALGIEEDVNQGRYAEALSRLDQLRKEDPKGIASTLAGIMAHWQDIVVLEPSYADQFFQLWIDIVGESAPILLRWGRAQLIQGEFAAAETLFQRALRLLLEQKDEHGAAVVHCRLASLYCYRGQYTQAQVSIDFALQVFRSGDEELADTQHLSLAFHSQGSIYYLQQHYDKARSAYQMALDCAQRGNYPTYVAAAQSQLSKIVVICDQSEAGLRQLRDAIRITERLGFYSLAAEGQVDYSECLLALRRLPEAEDHLRDNWDYIQQQAPMYARMMAFVLRAHYRAQRDDRQGAAEDARIALDFFEKQQVFTLWRTRALAVVNPALATELA